MKMPKILKDMLTGKDNETYSAARMLWLGGGVTFIFLSVYHVVVGKHPFDYQQFGTGLGLVLAGGGIGVGAQASTEPGAGS